MTRKQIQGNIRALKLLRRSYKAKKPFAYGVGKGNAIDCPLCEIFYSNSCRGCVWCEMSEHHRLAACERMLPSISSFYGLKAKTAAFKVMNRRLQHLEVQLQWLADQKAES